ncbi:Telomerase Cajal body protein 1 [Mortierella sp. 14UC]|nr:Telomerase Cajal body protein 1 [Mortierella sp. 14UC]
MDIFSDSQSYSMDHQATGEATANPQDAATYDNTYLQAQTDQEAEAAAASQEAWQSQTFQVYECKFDTTSSPSSNGSTTNNIVKTFSTGNLFNTTVGQSRTMMGIQGDGLKMTNGRENNFFKALKWSPDGSCLLSSSNDNCMRIFALPDSTAELKDTQLHPGVLIKEGEVIYDMCWYPGMTSADPATCCVLSSSRDHPVHLWDAFTGELRCSYTLVDHCEVNIAPNSLCFNLDGSNATTSSTPTFPPPQAPMGGLTQVQFSSDGVYLYSASRQDPFIRCWDIRNTASVLFRLERPGELTNQRLGFDISSDGRWLSTGDMNGDVSIFDLSNPTDPASERLARRIHGHDDVVSTATFHPTGSMLATSSGQRKYELFDSNDFSSDSNSDSDSDSEDVGGAEKIVAESILDEDFAPALIDNSISLWTLPGEYVWYVNGQRWNATDQSVQQEDEGGNTIGASVESTTALDEQIKFSTPMPTISGDVVMEAATTTAAAVETAS